VGSKLFCSCPTAKSEEFPYRFERRLRPAQGEMGGVDAAAVFEFAKGKVNVYLWSPESSCLVEADEEPPHPVNGTAVRASLLIAQLLHSNLVDEIHVMRKIVIDGSNTTGFQRTATVALGGRLEVDGQSVGVQTVTLEEDAARILGEDDSSRSFALDRLGVPLVEIALEPVTGTPAHLERVALYLGRALRSTGVVARGLGTIRQDLNVSVMGGSIVEVKGVQKLNLISKVLAYEISRQVGLIRVSEEIKRRGIRRVECSSADVTDVLMGVPSKAIQKQLEKGGKAVCVVARGMAGLLGYEPFPGIRLGKELAEIARANSLGGVIHSDEFASQGLSAYEGRLREAASAAKGDALVIVAGPRARVDTAVELIASRLKASTDGVPAETRAATEDGETRYMRPRPGAQRMYPETDIPEIVISDKMKEETFESIPEPWQEKVARYERDMSLSRDLALQVYDSGLSQLFERLCSELPLEPSFVASVLVELPTRLSREGIDESALNEETLEAALRAVGRGEAAKEAVPDILRLVGRGEAAGVQEAISKLGLKPLDRDELEQLISDVLTRNRELVKAKGREAFSPLMGELMKRVRGRADGKLVGELLLKRLAEAR
jgi:glutamyl-tRNA(Gln) amidotransferase subunit E